MPGPGELMSSRFHGFLSTSSLSGTVIGASCFLQSNGQNHPPGKGSDGCRCKTLGLGARARLFLCIETVRHCHWLSPAVRPVSRDPLMVNERTDGQKQRLGMMDLLQGSGPGQVGWGCRGARSLSFTVPCPPPTPQSH